MSLPVQGRGDPGEVWGGRGALPVLPAPHHRAAGGGGRAVGGNRTTGQLLWRPAG